MKDYTGHDLILATGVPGSRWSATLRVISFNKGINRSDERSQWQYERLVMLNGNKTEIGWHRGAYWGPNHAQGYNFDKLHLMTKAEIVNEFKKPYDDWESGVKIIKSHWFSYHLPLLKELFPDAKFIATWKTNEFSFNWWHKVGGWDISYPHYQWYENDTRMKKQIAIENANILNFFDLKRYTVSETLQALGLPGEMPTEAEIDSIDYRLKSLTEGTNNTYYDVFEQIISRNDQGIVG